MLTNYLKIAYRSLVRHKGYAAINVIGLAVGLAACLIISRYVQFERSYDRFHENADRIYRLVTGRGGQFEVGATARTSGPIAPLLKEALPEVVQAVRLNQASYFVARGEVGFQENGIYFADSTFFEVFSFPLLRGNAQTALRTPFSIVLTEGMARKYFGDADPMGQTLTVADEAEVTVTGILADVPTNSHLQFDMLVSMTTAEVLPDMEWLFTNWYSSAFHTYLLLSGEGVAALVADKLPGFVRSRAPGDLLSQEPDYALSLEPLTDVYLHSARIEQIGSTGDADQLALFALIGVFILVIACINFTNLATARSADRAREVGVRKLVGAGRPQLVVQFLAESVLLIGVAMGLAVALVQVLLPLVSELSGKPLAFGSSDALPYALALLGGTLAVGLLAGGYPALVLSGFQPATVLKGRLGGSRQGQLLRKGLVVVQFGISIGLMAATVVIFAQLRHLRSQDPGYDREQILVLDGFDAVEVARHETVKTEILKHPAVTSAAALMTEPVGRYHLPEWTMDVENARGEMQNIALPMFPVDFDFIPQYGIEVVAGRPFSRNFATDAEEAFVINEAALARFGYPSAEDALGRRVENVYPRGGTIIGVVRNFSYRSLHEPVGPVVMRIVPGHFNVLSLRLRTSNLSQTLAELEGRWQALVPQRPFAYAFLDEAFAAQYQAEQRFGQTFGLFAGLAIVIACLGLFGLVAFSITQRTKEIGIRKVMGASVPGLVALLSKEIAVLVLVAFVVAVPVAYLGLDQWLGDFASRTSLAWWMFGLAGAGTLAIALLTVGYQAVRAATADPVESLRYE